MRKKWVIFLAVMFFLFALAYLQFFFISNSYFGIAPDGSLTNQIPIQRDGNLYSFSDDTIRGVFTVKKSNIIIEGNNHTCGPIELDHVTNVTISNLNIDSSRWTIHLDHSSDNKILNTTQNNHPMNLGDSHNNIIENNTNLGVWMFDSNNNTIQNNVLHVIELSRSTNNLILRNNSTKEEWSSWLQLKDSKNNLIFQNQITNTSSRWITLFGTSTKNLIVANQVTGPYVMESAFRANDNLFYHNNFICALQFIHPSTDENNQTNQWDNGKEGNYYNTYQGQDTNNDKIGDTPHIINAHNQDNYPLINPIDLESEIQPQLTPYTAPTNQIPQTTIAAIVLVSAIVLGIGFYKRKTVSQILAKIDKKTYTLAATFSIISGITLVISTFYGFGTYLTYPSRGGYATSGHLYRILLIFLITLGASILISGWGHRKLSKQNNKKTANIKLIITLITAALLFYTAIIVSTANTGSMQQNEPYWNRFYIQDLDISITYTQLTIMTTALLGINQITAAKTTQKSIHSNEQPKLNKTYAIFQKFSGTAYIVIALISYPLPFMILLLGFLPLSILYLTTQLLSAVIFIHARKVTKSSEQTVPQTL
jgi:parallel beta-helix repeat protein